jgi:general secretion pathway protein N
MRLMLAWVALGLLGLLWFQWRDWSPTPSMPSVQPGEQSGQVDSADEPGLSEMLLPPASRDDYVSVIERPLFLPDRRPPPDEPEEEVSTEEEAPTDLDSMDLSAVLITPSLVSAWVRSPTEKEMIRLRIGMELEGWTVDDIQDDKLVLERQGETHELILRDYENAPPPIAPTPNPRRGARKEPQSREEPAGERTQDEPPERGRRRARQRTTTQQQADDPPSQRRSNVRRPDRQPADSR